MNYFDAQLGPIPKRQSPLRSKKSSVPKDRKQNRLKKSNCRDKDGSSPVRSSLNMARMKTKKTESTKTASDTQRETKNQSDKANNVSSSLSSGKAFGSLKQFWKTFEGNHQTTDYSSVVGCAAKNQTKMEESHRNLLSDTSLSSSSHADFIESSRYRRSFPMLLQEDDDDDAKADTNNDVKSLRHVKYSIPEDRPWDERTLESGSPPREVPSNNGSSETVFPQDELYEDILEKNKVEGGAEELSSSGPKSSKKSKPMSKNEINTLTDQESLSSLGNKEIKQKNGRKTLRKMNKTKKISELFSKKKRQPKEKQTKGHSGLQPLSHSQVKKNKPGSVETMTADSKHKNLPPLRNTPPTSAESSPAKTADESFSDYDFGCEDGLECLNMGETARKNLFSDLLCFDFTMVDDS